MSRTGKHPADSRQQTRLSANNAKMLTVSVLSDGTEADLYFRSSVRGS